ncbi:alpha/beta hydrolase [Paraglaciecola aestuariivivens]
MLKCFVGFTLVLLLVLNTAAAKEPAVAWDKLYGLGQVEYFTLSKTKADDTKQLYHMFVRVPVQHANSPKSYPTLYLLDGGTNFPLFSAYYQYLAFAQDVPEMIIVGISYGSQVVSHGNNRSTDFTAPSELKPSWGGAKAFDEFFTDQIMPAVQSRYAVDQSKQVLFGQSLGGQFALYTSMYGSAPFYAVIASNPAIHRNLDFFKQPLAPRTQRPLAYISSAEFDAPIFRQPTLDWQSYWQDKAPEWPRQFVHLAKHNHLSANPEVFRDGLIWVFKQN